MTGSITERPRPAVQSGGVAAGLALAGAIVTMIANFGIAGAVAWTGAAEAGVFFAATALISILGNSTALGTMTALVYFLPEELGRDRPNPRRLLTIALGPVLAVSVPVAGAVLLGAEAAAGVIAPDSIESVATMLRVLAIAVPGWAISNCLLGATRGLGSMTPTVVVNQVVKPVTQLTGIVAVVALSDGPSPALLALAWGGPIVAAAAQAFVAVWRLGGLTGGGAGSVPAATFWAYARPRALATTFQIALERIDVILVSALAGEAAAGIYGTITRFITAGNFLVFSIAQSTSPVLRRAIKRDRADAQRILHRTTGWMVLLAWPYFLLVALKPEPLIGLLNDDFGSGATTLSLLAVALLVHAATGPIDLTLLMLGRSKISLAGTAVALAVDIALSWLLLPRIGLIGAAVAWAIAVMIQNGVATYFVKRHGELRAPGPAVLFAAAGAVLAVVPAALVTADDLAGLLLTGVIAGVILVAWAVRFRTELDLPLPDRFRPDRAPSP